MEHYRFRMGQRVMLQANRQSGRVIGRAEWLSGRKAYLLDLDVRVAGKDERWHNETELTEED